MIALPPWAYDELKAKGVDMSNYHRVEYKGDPPKERVVRYLNRESRRAAARNRRKR